MSAAASNPPPWRAAVIGCGWIGSEVDDDPRVVGIQSHAGAYAACPQTRLIAMDSNRARAERAARRWGLGGGVHDVRRLLEDERPEIVSVCTPDATHADLLRQVLQSPAIRAVVVEEPLALDVREARSLVELARSRGVTFAVNYTRRYVASHVEAQRRVAAGAIGQIVAVQGLYTKGIIHNGSHWFDLACWFVGEITRVQA